MDQAAGAGPVRALDGRYYTDAAFYGRAWREIFLRTWQFAGHASQFEAVG